MVCRPNSIEWNTIIINIMKYNIFIIKLRKGF